MTWAFLIPLVLGFISNAASAFTGLYSRQWGERGGQAASFILRNVLGIPAWAIGFILVVQASSRRLIPTDAFTGTTGWIQVAVGGVVIPWALRSLGQRAVAPSAPDMLVADGLTATFPTPFTPAPSWSSWVVAARAVAGRDSCLRSGLRLALGPDGPEGSGLAGAGAR